MQKQVGLEMIRLNKHLVAGGLVILSFLLFVYIYLAPIEHAVLKFLFAVVVLGLTGYTLQRLYDLSGGYGLILLKTRKGLDLIDKLANSNRDVWTLFADIGLVWGFGLSGAYLLHKRLMLKKNKHLYRRFYTAVFVGLGLLLLTAVMIAPVVYGLAVSIVTGINMGKATQTMAGLRTPWYRMLSMAALISGGYTGLLFLGLIVYSGLVVSNVVNVLIFGATPIEPSGTLLLPGINLPLWEGLIALVILLIVHESAHGILSRIAKVRIDSAGIALFGFIPVGAFVDPDEKMLFKKPVLDQIRVMIAGSTANLFTMLISFIMLIIFLFLTQPYREEGVFVISGQGIPPGTRIMSLEYGSQKIDLYNYYIEHGTFSGLVPPNETVKLITDKGVYSITSDDSGRLGLNLNIVSSTGVLARYTKDYGWLEFIYRVLGLSVVLNFMVGIVNLLPLPGFDGYRILELNIKNKSVVKMISYLVLACFLLNFLPWLFK